MRKITYTKALNEALEEEMQRDKNVILIGEDIGIRGGAFMVTKNLYNKFGKNRVFDTPISESAIVGCSLGLAIVGMRPVAELMYIDFTFVAMDQILNQVAKTAYMSGGKISVPLVIRTQGGMGRGNAAQHSQSLEAFFYHIPGLKVVMPSNPYDAKGLLKSSIRDNSPVMFIEHKQLYNQKGDIPEKEYLVPLGKAKILKEGKDVTIITYSYMVNEVMAAAELLGENNIEAEVIDLRTIKPLDEEMIINSFKKTNRAVIVHEAHKRGGIGGDISALLTEKAFDYLDAPIIRLGGAETPIPYTPYLEKYARPRKENIFKTVLDLVKSNKIPDSYLEI